MWTLLTALLAGHGPAVAPAPSAPVAEVAYEFADGRLERAADSTFALPADGPLEPLLVRFERPFGAAPEATAAADRAELELIGGERLIGELAGGSGDLLEVTLVDEVRVPLSIDALLSLRFPERLGSEDAAAVERPSEGDRLYRRVGERLDRLDGFVEAFDAEGVRFESLVGSKQVPWTDVGALFIEPLGEAEDAEVSPRRVAVDLVNGSRLMGELGRADAAGVSLDLAGGTAVRLPTDALLRLSVLDGRLTYLSDLEPARFEGGSAFGDDLGPCPGASASWRRRSSSGTSSPACACSGAPWRWMPRCAASASKDRCASASWSTARRASRATGSASAAARWSSPRSSWKAPACCASRLTWAPITTPETAPTGSISG
jgi:hypothetical protein